MSCGIRVTIIEPLPDNEVDAWRGSVYKGAPFICSTVYPEVLMLKLSADDSGMAEAINLYDPFQYEFQVCGKFAQPIRLHEVCEYLPEAA